jgi:hypothetical protein
LFGDVFFFSSHFLGLLNIYHQERGLKVASVEQTPEGWVIRFDSIEEFLQINSDPKPWTEDPDLARKDRADERIWGY